MHWCREYNIRKCSEMDWWSSIWSWFWRIAFVAGNCFPIIDYDWLISQAEIEGVDIESKGEKEKDIVIIRERTWEEQSSIWQIDGLSKKNCRLTSPETTTIIRQNPKTQRRIIQTTAGLKNATLKIIKTGQKTPI